MDPELALAQELRWDAELLLAQARHRSSASRAYYASYHACIALLENLGVRSGNYLGKFGRPAGRWEHGFITLAIGSHPAAVRVLGLALATQVRWQYAQRIRGDYRPHEAVSELAARTSLRTATLIVTRVEEHVHVERA